MKKNVIISCCLVGFIIGIIIYVITNRIDYTLPKNPTVFKSLSYENPKDTKDGYHMIKYKDRSFVFYGTLNSHIGKKEVKKCVGYLEMENDKKNKNVVVCLLNDTDDYIMITNLEGEMEQPSFFRALDTVSKKIKTPKYIRSLDYKIWK